MPATMRIGVEQAVPLATTVNVVTAVDGSGAPTRATTIAIYESDVDVYIVTKQVADGAALPDQGRPKFTVFPVEYRLPSGFVGLVGSGAGTCRAEVR